MTVLVLSKLSICNPKILDIKIYIMTMFVGIVVFFFVGYKNRMSGFKSKFESRIYNSSDIVYNILDSLIPGL